VKMTAARIARHRANLASAKHLFSNEQALSDALDDLATLHEFVEAVCLHCAPCDVPADYKDSCPPMCADHDLCDALAALDLEATTLPKCRLCDAPVKREGYSLCQTCDDEAEREEAQ